MLYYYLQTTHVILKGSGQRFQIVTNILPFQVSHLEEQYSDEL